MFKCHIDVMVYGFFGIDVNYFYSLMITLFCRESREIHLVSDAEHCGRNSCGVDAADCPDVVAEMARKAGSQIASFI